MFTLYYYQIFVSTFSKAKISQKKYRMKISKRDVKFIVIGAILMFTALLIYDWDEFKRGFNAGYGSGTPKIENADK